MNYGKGKVLICEIMGFVRIFRKELHPTELGLLLTSERKCLLQHTVDNEVSLFFSHSRMVNKSIGQIKVHVNTCQRKTLVA